MKLTKKVIFNLNEMLSEINIPATFQFNYVIKRNKDKFSTIVKNVPVFQAPNTKEYKEYLEKVKEKVKKEEIKFKEVKEINTFYETEINNFPKALEQRKAAIDKHLENVEKWENEEVDIDVYTLLDEKSIPDGLTQEQFEIILEYFTKKKDVKK